MKHLEIDYADLCKELDEIIKLNPQKGTAEYEKMQALMNSINEYEEEIYNKGR